MTVGDINSSMRMFMEREKMREELERKRLEVIKKAKKLTHNRNDPPPKPGKAGPNGVSGSIGISGVQGTSGVTLNTEKVFTTSTSGTDFKEQPPQNKPKKIIFNIEKI